jgi:molybdopterin molybdotransferase
MISVPEARQLIAARVKLLRKEDRPLPDALGYILAEDIFSAIDVPPFDQSAVDGYAFAFADCNREDAIVVDGEIQAGSFFSEHVNAQHAVRIFTGAPVPASTDTVVMQEKVEVEGKEIWINDDQLVSGSNVRLKGSQTRKGDKALQRGHLINPATISFLASLGVASVRVYGKPKVRIIVTGKELVTPGIPLKSGKIYESNSAGLAAALQASGITPLSIEVVDDDERAIIHAINRSSDVDILILTGGASVGDYDFVPSALTKCGVLKVFHKVKQKPGKPFFFGIEGDMLVFGLPGNPAAVLSCYYQYIAPSIAGMEGKSSLTGRRAVLTNGYKKKPGLTYFLKGKTTFNNVEILDSQESYLMNSFAHANCLIELEEEKEVFAAGDTVQIYMIQ